MELGRNIPRTHNLEDLLGLLLSDYSAGASARSLMYPTAQHPKGHGPRVIYGEACRLSEATLKREGITFRQVPYALREGLP